MSLRGRLGGGGRGRRGEWGAAVATALNAHCEGMEFELAEEHLRNSDDDQQNGGEVFPMSDEEDSQTSSSSSDESDNERPAEEDRQTSSSSSATQAAEDPCAGYPVLGGGGTIRYPHALTLLVPDPILTAKEHGFINQTYGLPSD